MKKVTFKWNPTMSPKQKTILAWWKSDKYKNYDGIIADGAIRSGKTSAMGFSYVVWAMTTFNNQNFGLCGKTIGSLRRNVINQLKQQINQRKGWYAEEKRADNLIVVTHNGRKNFFYMFSGNDERSQDLIQGITLAGCFFDEVALMPESFVNQATGRCSVDGSKFWFNCNPAGPQHWFKVNWIDKCIQKNILYLHFTMDDNLSLTESIKKRYRSMYSGVFFQRYINGLWCIAEGLIYDMFETAKHTGEVSSIELTGVNRFVSCDYGTQNATVFLLWEKTKTGRWYCKKEYYYSGRNEARQKTDSQYADDLIEWLDGTKVKAIIVDPAAASFIAELRKRGFSVIKAKNDVIDGIRLVAMLLHKCMIIIDPSCKNTVREFQSYAWDEKAVIRGEDKPIKIDDHCMDAIRYFCMTYLYRLATIKERANIGIS